MTRYDIIKLARETGIHVYPEFERFAALVSANNQDKVDSNNHIDWTNSETGLLECWKNPLHSMSDRLRMADGAIAFRDKTIANLRSQLAAYQSTQHRQPLSTERIQELADDGLFHRNIFEIVRQIEEEHDIFMLKSTDIGDKQMRFIDELKQFVKDQNDNYYKKKVDDIKNQIKKRTLSGHDTTWVTFYWDDGSYEKIIEYFESEGIEVKCPTSSDDGDSYTSYLFKWNIHN